VPAAELASWAKWRDLAADLRETGKTLPNVPKKSTGSGCG
jgi:hypothetical protein